jgi:C1A family cysteine protease
MKTMFRNVWPAILLVILSTPFCAIAQTSLPATVDWRSAGAVGPVRMMGQCDGSWAFAAAAAVEGAKAIKSGQLVALSEQELIDCSGVDGNHGCSGGSVDAAFQWIARHGITAESQYPYTARDGSCRMGKATIAIISSFHRVAVDLQTLMAAVAKQPVAVEIDGSSSAFHDYSGGIYACHPGVANFWVTIVGYGTDGAGRAYWIVKSPLGTGWGEHGYMRMARSADCSNIGAAVVPVM